MPGCTHVVLEMLPVDQTVNVIEESGGPVSGDSMWLGDAMALFVRDPDHDVIELRESKLD